MGFFFLNFSNSLLFVYRNTTDFCIFIFYPMTLLNLFFSSIFFNLVKSQDKKYPEICIFRLSHI